MRFMNLEKTMKTRVICTIVLAFLLMGCSYKTTRIGYDEIDDKNLNIDSCEVAIVQDTSNLGEQVQIIGTIELGETGFTVNCDEEDALQFLKEEACLQGANIVHITSEKRSDFLSSCYRPTATLIRTNDIDLTTAGANQNYYSQEAMSERGSSDNKRKAGMMTLAILGGLLAGLSLSLLIF